MCCVIHLATKKHVSPRGNDDSGSEQTNHEQLQELGEWLSFEYFASKLACDHAHTALADKRTNSRGRQGCTKKCVSPRDSDDCGSEQFQDLGEWLSFEFFASNSV